MILDCDGKNVLTVPISNSMKNKTETVKVADGAKCTMTVKNSVLGSDRTLYVNYTIFHGNEPYTVNNPIVMAEGDSFFEEVSYFQRIPQCYFKKLEDHIDLTTIYTGTDSSNQAVDWLMKDSSRFSSCERKEFLERYALATINFAAPINTKKNATQTSDQGLWITTERHCVWPAVGCANGNVVSDLNYEDLGNSALSGTIATEIGLLTNLTHIGMSYDYLSGTIPSEIGKLNSLKSLSLNLNALTGSIPTEVGMLAKLTRLDISDNFITGTIPSEIEDMKLLVLFWVYNNSLEGSIPSEIGRSSLSSLSAFVIDGNRLTGTIPSTMGQLKGLVYFGLSLNSITGSIPSELGQTSISSIVADQNFLTGSVPSDLLDISRLDVFGNKLSNLIPIDDYVICSDPQDEHYCNCGYHCLSSLDLPGIKRCECEDARACCDTFLESNTECVICEYGFQDPDYDMSKYIGTCNIHAMTARQSDKQYGTPEKCDALREATLEAGCQCNSMPPSYPECAICEYGFENPDVYLEALNGTCRKAQLDITESHPKYGLEVQCNRARTVLRNMGCKCNKLWI